MKISDCHAKAITAYCRKRKIPVAYLFGSQARGDSGAHSDIDLAFLMKQRPSLDEHAQLVTDMMHILGDTRVDVVVLNNASPVLKFEVISEGKTLYRAMGDDAINAYEMGVIRDYYDTGYLRHVQDLYMREKYLGIPCGF